jgi:hypothetical protein
MKHKILKLSESVCPKSQTEPVERKPRKSRRKKGEADLPDMDKNNPFYGEKK